MNPTSLWRQVVQRCLLVHCFLINQLFNPKGVVYPSLYPSPWSKKPPVAGRWSARFRLRTRSGAEPFFDAFLVAFRIAFWWLLVTKLASKIDQKSFKNRCRNPLLFYYHFKLTLGAILTRFSTFLDHENLSFYARITVFFWKMTFLFSHLFLNPFSCNFNHFWAPKINPNPS